jgi:membrane dipeptidase
VLLTLEAGEALAGQLASLAAYQARGVALFQPVGHHADSDLQGSLERPTGGLTPFGRAVITEANRLGLLLDISHLSPTGQAETIAHSAWPVAFSHGACRALVDHPHNLTDAQLRRLAARGGVFGLAVVDAFLGGASDVETVVHHIDHAIQLIGPAHVGLGTDFDGTDRLAAGLASVDRLPNLTAALLARGYGEVDLAAILGGNWLRLLGDRAAPTDQP